MPLGKTFFNEIEKILIFEHDSVKMKTYVNGKNNKESRGEKKDKISLLELSKTRIVIDRSV